MKHRNMSLSESVSDSISAIDHEALASCTVYYIDYLLPHALCIRTMQLLGMWSSFSFNSVFNLKSMRAVMINCEFILPGFNFTV